MQHHVDEQFTRLLLSEARTLLDNQRRVECTLIGLDSDRIDGFRFWRSHMDWSVVGNEITIKWRVIVNETDLHQHRAHKVIEVEHCKKRHSPFHVSDMGGTVARLADIVQSAEQVFVTYIIDEFPLRHFVVERSVIGNLKILEIVNHIDNVLKRTAAIERTLVRIALLRNLCSDAILMKPCESFMITEDIEVLHSLSIIRTFYSVSCFDDSSPSCFFPFLPRALMVSK